MHSAASTCRRRVLFCRWKIKFVDRVGAGCFGLHSLLPTPMRGNHHNAFAGDIMLVCKRGLSPFASGVLLSNVSDFLPSQFDVGIFFAEVRRENVMRSLTNHVPVVLCLVAEVQMIGINAPSNVTARAAVKNICAVRYGSPMNNPTRPVSENVFTLPVHFESSTKVTVATCPNKRPFPQPMSRRDKHAGPESAGERRRKSLLGEKLGINIKPWRYCCHRLLRCRLGAVTGRARALSEPTVNAV